MLTERLYFYCRAAMSGVFVSEPLPIAFDECG